MKPLLQNWHPVANIIRHYRYVLLCLDYDGTLTPIVKAPELALISDTIRNSLQALKENPKYVVSIVSGRSLTDVKNLVGVEGLIYVGNHGLELSGPKIHYLNTTAKATKPLLKKIAKILEKELGSVPGISIENKILSLSVHFRQIAKNDVHPANTILHDVTRQYQLKRKIKLSYGKKVTEIRPLVNWDKGKIVKWLLKRLVFIKKTRSIIPIYIGDDLTDEDAYRALSGRGITIHVGQPNFSSRADYRLMNVREVKIFLRKLSAL